MLFRTKHLLNAFAGCTMAWMISSAQSAPGCISAPESGGVAWPHASITWGWDGGWCCTFHKKSNASMWVRTCSSRTLSTSSFNRDLQGICQFCTSMVSSAFGIGVVWDMLALVLLASRFKRNLFPLKLIVSSSSPQVGSSSGQCLTLPGSDAGIKTQNIGIKIPPHSKTQAIHSRTRHEDSLNSLPPPLLPPAFVLSLSAAAEEELQ